MYYTIILTLKVFDMKKTLLSLIFVFSFLSCSTDNDSIESVDSISNFESVKEENSKPINEIDCMSIQESSEGFLNLSCSLQPLNPFTSQLSTFNFGADPTYQDFGASLNASVSESIYYYLTGQFIHQAQRPSSKIFVNSASDNLYLPQIINTSGLYPLIGPSKSNVVASHIICKYVNQIQNLYSTNPIPGWSYGFYITGLTVTFPMCGGTQNAYVNISYNIYKEKY